MTEFRRLFPLSNHSQQMRCLLAVFLMALPTTGQVSADLNGDGYLDAVFANMSQRNRICLGDGMGDFTCSDVSPDDRTSVDVALGDVNRDGKLDAVFANAFNGQMSQVCLREGTGGFICSDVGPVEVMHYGVGLGDANSDGNLDAIFANPGWHETNRVCLGDGAGEFTCSNVGTDTEPSYGVALDDVNGDAKLDAVFANSIRRANRVCLGDGAGGFTCSDVSADEKYSEDVALGDVNGDGKVDAVFANFAERNRVCLGDGAGGFACSDVSEDQRWSVAVALGDVNRDSYLDAVFANGVGTNRVCLGDGAVSFTCSDVHVIESDGSEDVDLGDVNGDGKLDAVFAYDSKPNRLCLGNGTGGFACSDVSADARHSNGVALSPAEPSMTMTKSSTTGLVAIPGQVVPYNYVLRNTGGLVLHDVLLTDDNVDALPVCLFVGSDELTVAPDLASIVVCTAQHMVTPAEIEAEGKLANTATATSDETGPIVASLAITIGIFRDGFEADCPCWTISDLSYLPLADNNAFCEFQDDGTFGLIEQEGSMCEHSYHTSINFLEATCTVNRFSCSGLPDLGVDLHGISDKQYFGCLDQVRRRCEELGLETPPFP